jgi:hypothetical protein
MTLHLVLYKFPTFYLHSNWMFKYKIHVSLLLCLSIWFSWEQVSLPPPFLTWVRFFHYKLKDRPQTLRKIDLGTK